MRVVIEQENPRVAAGIALDLEGVGHSATSCGGPAQRAGRECPLLAGRDGGLDEEADVVLSGLSLDKLCVFIAQHTNFDRPVVIGLSEADRTRWPVLEQLGPWVPRSLRGPQLVQALQQAADLGAPS